MNGGELIDALDRRSDQLTEQRRVREWTGSQPNLLIAEHISRLDVLDLVRQLTELGRVSTRRVTRPGTISASQLPPHSAVARESCSLAVPHSSLSSARSICPSCAERWALTDLLDRRTASADPLGRRTELTYLVHRRTERELRDARAGSHLHLLLDSSSRAARCSVPLSTQERISQHVWRSCTWP